jgi:hypothetical protein
MSTYWLLFFVPAFQAVSRLRQAPSSLAGNRWPDLWRIIFVLIALLIGLRHQVGGDWANYLSNIEKTANLTLSETFAISRGDPADGLINWVASQSGLGIYLVNSVYAALFTWGLLVFCRNQPRPWLALTVAVPYLITVVAMGYSRQGVAIGLVMLGLAALENKGVFKFVLWVALAALFHKSAIILVPLAMVAGTRRRLLTLLWVGLTAAVLFSLLLQEYVDNLVSGYITDQYESSGAAIRVAMNALPATLFLLFRKRFQLVPAQRTFWTWMAMGALAFIALLYISPSSTAVDRVALYWIPLQLFVWSRVPDAMGHPGARNAGLVYAVVAYSAAVQFVWLFFATHSVYWLPYKFYPLVWLWQ